MKPLRAVALAATLAAFSACASPHNTGESPGFQAGWADGCRSALALAGADGFQHSYARDEKRYRAEADYREGWNAAYRRCRERPSPMMI